MNKLRVLAAILAILILQACKGRGRNDSIAKADSVNAANDTTQRLHIIVGQVDAEFAVRAASGCMAEMNFGELAQQKGMDRRVRNFGKMMVNAHSKINDKIKALAATKNIALPAAPGADAQKAINVLSKKSGKDFDKAYVNNMIDDHKKDIRAFETAMKKCDDPDLKSFASKMLPVLQTHLDALNAINDSMR
ncbi:MAG: DUF4142 domain-containing protein [Mucilaginibacter sp.]